MKKIVLVLIAAALVFAILARGEASAEFSSVSYNLEIVRTAEEKALGLSGRDQLDVDSGMLFVYEKEGFYSFWMKDMRFAIDILWISSDFRVVDIERDVSPDSYPQTYVSLQPAQYVLEINAGEAFAHGIQRGEEVRISGL